MWRKYSKNISNMTPAKKIYILEQNKNYRPGDVIINSLQSPITALHCIYQPTKEVVFKTIENQRITIPPSGFVPGAIYPYSIIEINQEGARCFLGISY